MTIRQLLDSCIAIEGNVKIKQWNYEIDTEKILYSTTCFNSNICGDFLYSRIIFMYPTEENGQGWLIIEVE